MPPPQTLYLISVKTLINTLHPLHSLPGIACFVIAGAKVGDSFYVCKYLIINILTLTIIRKQGAVGCFFRVGFNISRKSLIFAQVFLNQ